MLEDFINKGKKEFVAQNVQEEINKTYNAIDSQNREIVRKYKFTKQSSYGYVEVLDSASEKSIAKINFPLDKSDSIYYQQCWAAGDDYFVCGVGLKRYGGLKMELRYYSYNFENNKLSDITNGDFGDWDNTLGNVYLHPQKPYFLVIKCLQTGRSSTGSFDSECKRYGIWLGKKDLMEQVVLKNGSNLFKVGWNEENFFVENFGSKSSQNKAMYTINLW